MKIHKFINYLFIAVSLSILLGILFVFYLHSSNKENIENKRKIWAASFGGGNENFHNAVKRISTELSRTNVFDEITTITDIDLKNDSEFWGKHKNFIENNKRGYGYWIWKPYLIKKTLEKMNNGDILLYLDAGCEVKDDNNNGLSDLIEKCRKLNVMYTTTGHMEKPYAKMDTVSIMNVMNDDILNSIQHQATIVFIKKNEMTVDFVNDWYSNACNYHLLDDSPSKIPNDPMFVDHRHDQCIFSLLIKSDKYKNEINNPENLIDDPYPIVISRKVYG